MTIIRWARALALALMLCAPGMALAQIEGSSVQFPAGYAPSQSICTKQANGKCVPVSADNPLPVTGGGGGGGGGDASALKQDAQIALEQAIRDRLGDLSAPVAGSLNKTLRDLLLEAQKTDPVPVIVKPSKTNAVTSVTAATGSTLLLSPNDNRLGCSVANNSSAILYISQSSGVSSTNYQWPIDAKTTVAGTFLCPPGWTGAVYGAWASATGNALVGEWTP